MDGQGGLTGPHRLIIGIDPGPVPGIASLWVHTAAGIPYWNDVEFGFGQCDPDTLMDLLDSWTDPFPPDSIILATETYVIGNRSGKSSAPKARYATIDLLERAKNYADQHGIARVTRPAGIVKPFATNERLDSAGLLAATTGSTHARDASRHLLYCAVHDCGFPDPFSKKGRQ